MEDAPVLRSRLAQSNPVLSASLEEAVKIARNEWLPALPTNAGSSNAYPHLRNVAGYLEHVVLAFEDHGETGFEPLSPGEIYVALLSVLFHDYGRLDPRSQQPGVGHGTLSYEHLGKHHAELGIHTAEVAQLVGQISETHSFGLPPESRREREPCEAGAEVASAIARLSDAMLDEVGTIRTPLLAGLLCLADQMDAAYTRSVPEYLTEEKGGVIGLFRRHIRGVSVDPRTRLVKMAMTLRDPEAAGKDRYRVRFTGEHGQEEEFVCKKKLLEWPDAKEAPPCPWLPICAARKLGWEQRKLLSLLTTGRYRMEHLLARAAQSKPNTSEPKKPEATTGKADEADGFEMPRYGPHAIAFGNMHENHSLLGQVAPVLRRYGILLESWLVEIDGRLFKHTGEETFEPILSQKLLLDITDAMWALSVHTFGSTSFTYEDVAAYLGDPFVWRVKVACRRIATLMAAIDAKAKHEDKRPVPWTGVERWHWHGTKDQDKSMCRYMNREEVRAYIEGKRLKDPRA